MSRVSGLSVCLLVLVISLDTAKSRWINDEQMEESPIEYKNLRDRRSSYSDRDSQRLRSHFINLERLKKRVGIAGLDNMDIMTRVLEEARQRGVSFILRRKGESPNRDMVLTDLRKLMESAGKRR